MQKRRLRCTVRFFDRISEIEYLRSERELAKRAARMTVVTGRRLPSA